MSSSFPETGRGTTVFFIKKINSSCLLNAVSSLNIYIYSFILRKVGKGGWEGLHGDRQETFEGWNANDLFTDDRFIFQPQN